MITLLFDSVNLHINVNVRNQFVGMIKWISICDSWEVILELQWLIMGAMASQITSLTIVYSTVYSRGRTSKFCVTGLCEGNSPVAGEFPAQRASNAENVSFWWRHHGQDSFFPDVPDTEIGLLFLCGGFVLDHINRKTGNQRENSINVMGKLELPP